MSRGLSLLLIGGAIIGMTALVARVPLTYWAMYTENQSTKKAVRGFCLCGRAMIGAVCTAAGVIIFFRS
jgi:hypothetical protein